MDEKKGLLMASSGAMEKQGIGAVTEEQQQQQILPVLQLAQKCPRCDSTNTKFCYYNNYSLSQPRHFCKACKRYWTRGGTLRNVPVGGGCRKNKRLKIIRTPPPPPPVTSTTVIARDLPIASNPMMLSGNYTASRVVDHLFPEEAPGLGFSSSAGQLLFNGHDFFHNYSSSASCQTAMNSLLASTIEHQKFISGGNVQLKDDSSAMNKVQGQINYNYPVGNGNGGNWNNYLGYQMEDQHVIGLSSSTTADPNYYWSMSNNANTSNNWHDPPAANTHESPLPSFI